METGIEPPGPSAVYLTVKQGAQTLQAFFNKFNNDWVMGFASALAFNLITAILPMLIAIVAIVGFAVKNLDPLAEQQLINHLQSIFPAHLSKTRPDEELRHPAERNEPQPF